MTSRRLLAALPWALTGLLLAGAWHWADVPDTDIGKYSLYLAIAVVLPGTLVHRALRGSRGNLPEDLGYGAATGLLLQLAGWALAAAIGLQVLLPYWPLLVPVLFLTVPALRRHWRIADPRPLPVAWSWLICGALVLLIAAGAAAWTSTPLPPADTIYYPDLMYHLALVHEMTRSMPFEVPQLAGDPLRYHYLSDADMAIGSMSTGIPAATVLLRLWLVPIGAIAVVVIAALTRELGGRWWAGPLAGAVAFAGLPLTLGAPISPYGGASLAYASPSQSYAMPLLGLLVALAADVVRDRPLGRAGGVVPALALACAGAKSSALPPLVAGLALTAVVLWWRNRAFPRVVALLFGVLTGMMLIGARLFAGGGAGTLGVQPLSLLRWMEPYNTTLGLDDGVAPGGLFPPGMQDIGLRGAVFIAIVLGWWLLMQSPRLLGLLAVRKQSDPAAWLLGGMVAAGFGAALLLWHPSASQLYFLLCAGPFGVVLTVWMLAERVRRWWVAVAGLVAGAGWALLAPAVARPMRVQPVGARPVGESQGDWVWALGVPVLRAAGFVLAGAVVVVVLAAVQGRRRAPAAVDPAAVDPAAVDPAAVDPAAVDPAAVEPTASRPAILVGGPLGSSGPVGSGGSLGSSGPVGSGGPLGSSGPVGLGGSSGPGDPLAGRAGLGGIAARAGAGVGGWRRLRVLLVAVPAAVLGASLVTGASVSVTALVANEPAQPATARLLTQEEMRAALWLDEHAGNEDVVATNVHCVPMARYKPCDARAFWVAGLGGRRTVVESWAYSDATVAANGVRGLKYVLQPPPDPERYALNQRVFTDGEPADLVRLRQAYRVTWLLADRRAGAVSPELAGLARVRYSAGPVTIYELR